MVEIAVGFESPVVGGDLPTEVRFPLSFAGGAKLWRPKKRLSVRSMGINFGFGPGPDATTVEAVTADLLERGYVLVKGLKGGTLVEIPARAIPWAPTGLTAYPLSAKPLIVSLNKPIQACFSAVRGEQWGKKPYPKNFCVKWTIYAKDLP